MSGRIWAVYIAGWPLKQAGKDPSTSFASALSGAYWKASDRLPAGSMSAVEDLKKAPPSAPQSRPETPVPLPSQTGRNAAQARQSETASVAGAAPLCRALSRAGVCRPRGAGRGVGRDARSAACGPADDRLRLQPRRRRAHQQLLLVMIAVVAVLALASAHALLSRHDARRAHRRRFAPRCVSITSFRCRRPSSTRRIAANWSRVSPPTPRKSNPPSARRCRLRCGISCCSSVPPS